MRDLAAMIPSIAWGFACLSLLSVGLCQSSQNGTDPDYASTRKRLYPPHFWFGISSEAYQIEGAWNAPGKSKSIWDVWTHTPGNIKDKSTGDDACKSYEFYSKCDSAMLKYLGVTSYRLSLSWSRILPDGFPTKVNQEAIDYYNNILEDLIFNGIHPIVTIYDSALPERLQQLGGWANPLVAQWFEDYARVVFENFVEKVNTWITINDPKQISSGYASDKFAPGLADHHGIGDYIVAKNILMAHAKVFYLYDKKYRPRNNGAIGIGINTDFHEPLTDSPEDIQAASDAMDFNVGLYAQSLFTATGGFPARVKELVAEKSKQQGYFHSRLIDFTDAEVKYLKEAADFYAMNHYTTFFWTRSNYKTKGPVPSMDDDLGAVKSFKNYTRTASEHIAVVPQGLKKALKYIKDKYDDPLILITDNGVATDEGLEDHRRVDYMKKYFGSLLDSIYDDETRVAGLSVRSFMDDFEWKDGYKLKFGLFKVDHEAKNKRRQAKLSAIWYKRLISQEALDPKYVPRFEKVEFCAD